MCVFMFTTSLPTIYKANNLIIIIIIKKKHVVFIFLCRHEEENKKRSKEHAERGTKEKEKIGRSFSLPPSPCVTLRCPLSTWCSFFLYCHDVGHFSF